MAKMRIEKVNNTLPGTLTANTLYFVNSGGTVQQYLTDQTGANAYLISGGGGSGGGGHSFLHMGAANR